VHILKSRAIDAVALPLWLSSAVLVKAATSKEVVFHHTLSQQVEHNHKRDDEQELYHFAPIRPQP
jgi:hypothetical protein